MKNTELQSLIMAWLDGLISETESLTLQAELKSNPEARAEFLRWTKLDAAIREQAEKMIPTNEVELSNVARPRGVEWLNLRTTGWLVAAASILMAVAFWSRSHSLSQPNEAMSYGCAMLSQVLDASFDEVSLQSGDTLKPGMIRLSKGLAQIELFSGATVLVEGAAEIEIVSAWEAKCLSGRVRVHVPPAAKGFLMHAPGLKLEDLGTEFALNVKGETSAVHVFDGEVIAHTKDQAPSRLKEGMSLASKDTSATTGDFLPISELQDLIRQRAAQRFTQWQARSMLFRKDGRLIAYYPFKHWEDDKWDRVVNNLAEPKVKSRTGGAVGAQWTQGRWPGKDALEFKRPGDRVRLNLDGTYAAITLSCWVKVDSVDKKYNSLLLTDGYENGEPHWQIYEDGSLMFSIIYRPNGDQSKGKWNQIYYSKPVFTSDSLGRWHHLAVTYDASSGTAIQYFDGREVSREVSPLHQSGREIVFGPCEIGNWGLPTPNHEFPIRNLNGAIDEFAIYRDVLPATDIYEYFVAGKPE